MLSYWNHVTIQYFSNSTSLILNAQHSYGIQNWTNSLCNQPTKWIHFKTNIVGFKTFEELYVARSLGEKLSITIIHDCDLSIATQREKCTNEEFWMSTRSCKLKSKLENHCRSSKSSFQEFMRYSHKLGKHSKCNNHVHSVLLMAIFVILCCYQTLHILKFSQYTLIYF